MAAEIYQRYGISAAFTITLASLATSSTRTAGRESNAVTNSPTVAADYLVSGKITTGTSPTAGKVIQVWTYASMYDFSSFPDVFDGADSAETVTSENVRNSALRLAVTMIVDATSDRTYWFAPFSVAALYGGLMPYLFGLFVTHDTGVNLNSTGGNHDIRYLPVWAQVA